MRPDRRADDLQSLKKRLEDHADRLVLALLGEPTAKGRHTWRWGSRGSLSYDFERHYWHSFETDEGGDLFDLIRFGNPGWDLRQALAWAGTGSTVRSRRRRRRRSFIASAWMR
jgi:hypothetical protein